MISSKRCVHFGGKSRGLDRLCGLVVRVPDYRFDSRHYQIFWEVVGLEGGPLSLVSTTEELLERKSSGFGLENREYGRRGSGTDYATPLFPQKLAQTSPTNGGRSVRVVRSRTRATKFCLLISKNFEAHMWENGDQTPLNRSGFRSFLIPRESFQRRPLLDIAESLVYTKSGNVLTYWFRASQGRLCIIKLVDY
jgi:hypothetical protein